MAAKKQAATPVQEESWHKDPEKRGKALVALGNVSRNGSEFEVKTASVAGKQKIYFVGRHPHTNAVICNCPEFEENKDANTDRHFRCEHIWAAIHFANKDQGTQAAPAAAERRTHSTVKEARPTAAPPKQQEKQQVSQQQIQDDTVEPVVSIIPVTKLGWLAQLRAPVPKQLVKTRSMSWGDVPYIEWNTVTDILDSVVGSAWSFTVVDINFTDTTAICRGRLTITMEDGFRTERDGVGASSLVRKRDGTIGDDAWELAVKGAASDALKRAAVLFGIGRDLYEKDAAATGGFAGGQDSGGNYGGGGGTPASPVARSLSDLVTAKQLGMVRAIAREVGVDPDEECQKVFLCGTDNLSKRAASELIKHLQDMQKNQAKSGNDVPWERS